VELVVTDTGKGIPEAFLPHVFERFRQADSRFSREHGGLGLGLAISRDLVELHGGAIRAESAGEGTGSTFRVILPAMLGMVSRSREVTGEQPAVTRPHRVKERLDGIHVLAVDDEADALTLLREILEASGARVTTAGSVDAALDVLTRAKPQVLVADIGMPGTDGLEFMKRVRQSPDRQVREISAAALTAYARSEDRNRALRAGFQTHLVKPVDPDELVATVAALAHREDR
jgi:CheY-like chemotaxis protein